MLGKNMKQKLLFSQIAISVLVLASCGVNTKGWPRFEFEFEAKEIDSLILNYRCKKSKKMSILMTL